MNTKEVVKAAALNKTVIPALNIPYLPMVKPVVAAIVDENSVGIVEVSRLEWEKFHSESLEAVAEEYFKHCDREHTLLHLDHVPVIDEDNKAVDYLPIIARAIKAGYQSVMVDASRLPLNENIAATKKVVDMARRSGVAVEAELGVVSGHEGSGLSISYEELFNTKKGFTDIKEAERFAIETGCDWMSVAVGNIHGAIAESTRNLKKQEARLDIEHIAALYKATNGVPLVLHGGSGIKREYILAAIENGIAKINVAAEIRKAYEFALDERPGDVEYARQQVYDRARWVIRECFKANGNKTKLFGGYDN